ITSEVTDVRRGARVELALLGQKAIPRLMKDLSERKLSETNTVADYKTKVGIASALVRMKQPLQIDANDVPTVVWLLRSNDSETRLLTVDFIINLEDEKSLQAFFTELRAQVGKAMNANKPDQDGTFVINAVTAVGGWVTALNDSVKTADDPHKPIKD